MKVRILLIGAGVVVFGAFVLASGTAVAAEQEHPPPDDNVTSTNVGISIDSGSSDDGIGIMIEWTTRYPARSAAEAERAKNETLDVDWHQGPDYVQSLRERHPGGHIDIDITSISHQSGQGDEHGEIRIRRTIRWVGPFEQNDRLVIGPDLQSRLLEGDRLRISIPRSWSVTETSIENPTGRGMDHYRWTIGVDPDPHFVVTEDDAPDDPTLTDEDWERIGAVIAILFVGGILGKVWWDRRRES